MTEVQKILDKYGENIVYLIKNKLRSGNKVATGNLINSITYKYSYSNGQYNLQITGAPYLINVDRGRKPGKYVPIKPLEAWIKIKRIPIVKPKNAKNFNKARAIKGMAFAISTTIKRRGIKPFPILTLGKAVSNSAKFKQELAKAMAADLKQQIKLP